MSNTMTRKLKIVHTSTQPLRHEPGEAVEVGVDVHRASSRVALDSSGRGLLAPWVQPAGPELLLQRLRPLREGVAQRSAGILGFRDDRDRVGSDWMGSTGGGRHARSLPATLEVTSHPGVVGGPVT